MPTLHLGYRPGCIGRIAELHGSYYARTAGFGAAFEAKVATELAAFCLRYDPARDGLWLAEHDGAVHGAIVIDGSHAAEQEGAHLRWFITSDSARGQGLGRLLLGEALAFCRARGYLQVLLWTFDELHAARHLYEEHGFRLVETHRGTRWGKEVNEQLYRL